MAERKPKYDEQLVGDAKANMPHPSRETKAHGDKLEKAVEESTKKPGTRRGR